MTSGVLEVLEMPNWKHDILRAVAWILGYRGEHVYCVTMNIDLEAKRDEQRKLVGKQIGSPRSTAGSTTGHSDATFTAADDAVRTATASGSADEGTERSTDEPVS